VEMAREACRELMRHAREVSKPTATAIAALGGREDCHGAMNTTRIPGGATGIPVSVFKDFLQYYCLHCGGFTGLRSGLGQRRDAALKDFEEDFNILMAVLFKQYHSQSASGGSSEGGAPGLLPRAVPRTKEWSEFYDVPASMPLINLDNVSAASTIRAIRTGIGKGPLPPDRISNSSSIHDSKKGCDVSRCGSGVCGSSVSSSHRRGSGVSEEEGWEESQGWIPANMFVQLFVTLMLEGEAVLVHMDKLGGVEVETGVLGDGRVGTTHHEISATTTAQTDDSKVYFNDSIRQYWLASRFVYFDEKSERRRADMRSTVACSLQCFFVMDALRQTIMSRKFGMLMDGLFVLLMLLFFFADSNASMMIGVMLLAVCETVVKLIVSGRHWKALISPKLARYHYSHDIIDCGCVG
jgi:hypothetical protein